MISLSRQVCIARPILSVKELSAKEHIHSRLLSAPILATAKGAGRGNGPCAILTSRPGALAGPVTARLPGSHWEGWWGMQRQWQALPAAASNCLQSRSPAKAQPPAATGSQPHRAHSAMCPSLASSPRHHLRPSTAHYVARRSAPNLRHFSALATRCTPTSSIPRTPASLRHPVATFIPKRVHLVINSTLLNQPRCSILSFATHSPPPCQTWSVRSEAPTWASPTF